MEANKLTEQTRVELLALAKKQGLTGVSRLKKAVLIKLLLENRTVEKKTPEVIRKPVSQLVKPASNKTVKTGKKEKSENKRDLTKKPAVDSQTGVSFPKSPSFGEYRELSQWQEKITSSKYEIQLPVSLPPSNQLNQPAKRFSLSCQSKVSQAVLMIKDPYNLYLYWDIPVSECKGRLQVRIYDLTGKNPDRDCCYEIEVEVEGSSCYLRIPEADRTYFARIGYLDQEGKFHSLAASNQIHTPPIKIREELPQAGELSDKQVARLSRFFAKGTIGVSSEQTAGRFPEKDFHSDWASRAFGNLPLPETVSSFETGQPEKEKKEKRGFRFTLNTELIVYGATEPDAKVTVSGKPVTLRKDGTFSLRLALPDGGQVIPAVAISADQAERRSITPEISRKTNFS